MAERVGQGVEVLRLRPPGRVQRLTNIYLIQDQGGVAVFESGSRGMASSIAEAARPLGGVKGVLLSHAHADHRGGASQLGAPVLCHLLERPGAEGDGWFSAYDFSAVRNPLVRALAPGAIRRMDGGPLTLAGVLEEGDQVAGFRVLHLPGHTPGLIGLWRESDRLAIVSDAVFVFDPFTVSGGPGAARLPPRPVLPDPEAARASIRKIAELDPATVWLGHYGPLTGDVRGQLERAAAG
jgi:glyoxylase-like metal-dependent hydrolase (beta-lactamase superfamily II)